MLTFFFGSFHCARVPDRRSTTTGNRLEPELSTENLPWPAKH